MVGDRGHEALRAFELGLAGTDLRRSLVEAVLAGRKTSTSSLRIEYEPYTADDLPHTGERSIVLDVDNERVGVVEIVGVAVVPVGDVDLAFARDEGENYETVAEWRAAHELFWISNGVIGELTDDTLVVCERFRLVERVDRE